MPIIYEHILFSLNQSKYICDVVFPRTANHVRPHDVISSSCENSRFSSLLAAGDVSPGGTSTTQRLKLHTDDINQRLHNNDLRHQYGISVANSQTFLLEKRPQRRGERRNGCFRRLWYHLHLRTPSQFHKISAQERGIKHPCYTAETIGRPKNICFRRADMQLKRFCNPFQGSSPLPISAHRSVCYRIFRLRLPLTVS